MNIFIILLGCNIYSILLNRIDFTLYFINNNYYSNNNNKINITLFLSGGVKQNINHHNQHNHHKQYNQLSDALHLFR